MTTSNSTGQPRGRPGQRWTPGHDDELRLLNAEGVTMSEAARRMGFTPSVVSKRSRKIGVDWDRSRTEIASAARLADGIANRQRAAEMMYRLGFAQGDRLEAARFDTVLRTTGGAENAAELPFIPARDVEALGRTVQGFFAQAARLDAMGVDAGVERGKSMLQDLREQIGVKDMVIDEDDE